ncbi:hypothetical protein SNE35_28305 [Paucibacter sp. R3-3]|uniref:DUF1566 domain-containing protein n=1 Tax=Roseateles agri TaxID=3098619 RepID=A0ABU5DQ31_9BURK|nr:hypothetical protein [Paucibacter sp. R3-3]MDY0748435.1 hypothetical protein [Paucibacter sp. R3-3]
MSDTLTPLKFRARRRDESARTRNPDRLMHSLSSLAVVLVLALAIAAPSTAQTSPSSAVPAPTSSRTDLGNLRAVQPPSTPFSEWVFSNSHIQGAGDMARDGKSKLVWTRCLVGQRLEYGNVKCTGEASLMTLVEAQSYAAAQQGGWRVPTSEELQAILPSVCPPGIDFWFRQVIAVAIRGQRVLSSSRDAGASGVLMPIACTGDVQAEPISVRAPFLLVTADESTFTAKRREIQDRLEAERRARVASGQDAYTRAAAVLAGAAKSAPLLSQQDGTVTRIKLPGSLAPTRDLPCLRGDQIDSSLTPPDLHTGFLKCLDERRADDAVQMFVVAGAYSRYDAQRVDDPSVRAGPQVLIINTSSRFTPQQREFFVGEVQGRLDKPETTQAICVILGRIGPPTYSPRYLVLHGLKALTAANPMDNALVPGFDAESTWRSLLHSYTHCDK